MHTPLFFWKLFRMDSSGYVMVRGDIDEFKRKKHKR
jgi:hypothetical protein